MAIISVIVPVYRAENTLRRCVDSICQQSFQDMEILLIDDGSPDTSGKICDELAQRDSRIQVLHKKNGGVSSARNSGINLAKGKYLQFVDCDDYLPLDYCQALMDAQEEYGNDTFCWTSLQVVSENGSVEQTKFSYAQEKVSLAERSDVLKFSARYVLNSPTNKLYHRDIVEKGRLRMDEQLSIAEDLLFNLRYLELAGRCKIAILNHISYYYVRNGQNSLDSGYRQNYYEIHQKVLAELWEKCIEWQVPQEDYPLYDQRYWEYMQAALQNQEYKDCPLTLTQKIRENSRIISDERFQKCLSGHKAQMGRINYRLLKTGNYFLVWLYGKMRK